MIAFYRKEKCRAFTYSHIGENHTLVGQDNQDNVVFEKLGDSWYMVIADGVSSAACSGEGAQAAIVRGSCTTKFDPRASRATNIAVAASRINGVVIQPGEEFSFNRTILPRTAANGYVEAPIYVSGKHSTGTGGGICQVSSTMYSAMLNGGIPATERHPHSLPVPYLPEGRDATIAGNYYDLRFVNIYNTPLQISAVADLRTGTVSVTLIQQ